jgi:hypothetical protein
MNYKLTNEQLEKIEKRGYNKGINAAVDIIEQKAIYYDELSTTAFNNEDIDLSLEYAMRSCTLLEVLNELEPEFNHMVANGHIARFLS